MDDRVNERDGHMWRTGPHCKGKFGKERHDRRSTYSIWASSRSGRNCNSSWILEICHCTTESQKLGAAHRRAEKDKAITGGRDFRREAIKIRVRFRRDVKEGLGAIEPQTTSRPLLLNDRALSRSRAEPHKVLSSRYQLFNRRVGTSDCILSIIGCRVTEKPRRPRGSPC